MRTTIRQMIRVSWKESFLAFFVVTCLLLLLHILIVLAWNAQQTSLQVQQNLGVFLYLRDDAIEGGVQMLQEFTDAWLQSVFFSKDDAFRLLARRLPDILPHLEKYGIINPLPPTIYVTYKNQEQYETLKWIISRHEEAISNLDNLSLTTSFQEQTWRVSKLVSLLEMLIQLCAFLIVGVLVMMVTIISYVVTTLFYRFHEQVALALLLGGSWRIILTPFFSVVWGVMCLGRAGSVFLAVIGSMKIDRHFLDILEVSFVNNYLPRGELTMWLLWEGVILVLVVLVVTYVQVARLSKKI